jgi:C-terminal processing protease CtpA/Prc
MRTLALTLLIAFCPTAAFADARAVVRDIATLIDNNYFDADKASEIARDLRGEARAGAFDKYREPRDLAVALTARLKPQDQHFNVIWFKAPAGTIAPSALDAEGRTSSSGMQSHGFRSVSMLPGDIGYIEMRNFAYVNFAKADDPARLAADAALQLIAGASAVILDLRNNIGGYADMASYLVSAFMPADADIYNVVQRRGGSESERPKQPYRNPRTQVPLYVLVSGGTASAAEAAAYTLQAVKRATVIGERTSGAANPGGLFPVRDGFNVFISIGTPINPLTRTNWEGTGVAPDVPIPAEQALRHAQQLALETLSARASGDVSTDVPTDVKWALDALIAETKPPQRVPLGEYAGGYGDATIAIASDKLQLRRGRRSVQALAPLAIDRFFIVGEPGQHVVFERNTAGRIIGFQLLRSSAYTTWFPRGP